VSAAQELIKKGNDLFQKRGQLLSLWQEIANNFYPERADFTYTRNIGTEFATNLMTSYPIIVRRELGNAFSAMLRPRDKAWFQITIDREERLDKIGTEWLEWASGLQRRAMYDRETQFVRATKEGDQDFAAFGQTVISVEIDWERNVLLYRCWHLRDVAWCEDYSGKINEVHRKWMPMACQLAERFPKSLHPETKKRAEKDPYCTVECRHLIVPSEMYKGEKKFKTPYVSVYLDVEQSHVMEEVGQRNIMYVIPRWQTVSGSQYAYSPATVAGLADARLIQAMTLTLLEAGETAVSPPMIATKDAIRSDIALYAGGITWVDAQYDERLGEVLRPLTQDKRGLPYGMEVAAGIQQMLSQAFFLNKISLPPSENREMTAFETAQRVQEYIRNALPLFEPMEIDYNGALCELTFDTLMNVGAYGSPADIPQSLQGTEVVFKFESPLHSALEREKVTRFQEAKALVISAAEADPQSMAVLDIKVALRDALSGAGIPAKWTRDEETVAAMAQQEQQMQQAAQIAALAEQAGKAATEVARADTAMQQSGF
jgi:hypothetical protein